MRHGIWRDNAGAQRAEGVEILAEGDLVVFKLNIPGGYIVKEGVSEDAVHHLGLRCGRHSLSDHSCKFNLVVELSGAFWVNDWRSGSDDRGGHFREEERLCRHFRVGVLL